jgi:hypothetical protein
MDEYASLTRSKWPVRLQVAYASPIYAYAPAQDAYTSLRQIPKITYFPYQSQLTIWES